MKQLGVWRRDDVPLRKDSLDEMLDRIYDRHVLDVHRWVRRLTGPMATRLSPCRPR